MAADGPLASPELGINVNSDMKNDDKPRNGINGFTRMLSPKEKAIHQRTVLRHLSNRSLPEYQQSKSPHPNGQSSHSPHSLPNGSSAVIEEPGQKGWCDVDIAGDLPTFPAQSRSSRNFRKKSAPSLSKPQKEKLASGHYLHHSQIPRSLSFDFVGYQPSSALTALYNLPMYACIGVGGEMTKTQMLSALTGVEEHIAHLPKEEEDEVIHLHHQPMNGALEAIPMEPSASHSRGVFSVKSKSHRQSALEIKHELEVLLNQGYTSNLIFSTMQAVLGVFLAGWNLCVLNVPYHMIQQITGMSKTQMDLLNSLYCVGGLLGAIISGPMQNKFGRKRAMLMINMVYVISAAIIVPYAHDDLGVDPSDENGYMWFWTGRFVAGLASGGALAVTPAYLGEIAPPLIRGGIGAASGLAVTFGQLAAATVGYENILGGESTWPLLFAVNALPLLQLLTCCSFPESPKWLFQEGRRDEALRALQKLRMTKNVDADMDLMRGGTSRSVSFASHDVHDHKDQPLLNGAVSAETNGYMVHHAVIQKRAPTPKPIPTRFGIPEDQYMSVKWALIIAVLSSSPHILSSLMSIQQLAGINTIMMYSSTILNDAGITSKKGQWLGTIAIDAVNFLGIFFPAFLVDRIGRRKLLIISSIAIIITCVGVSFAIIMNDSESSPLWSYSSVGMLILYVLGFEMGWGPMTWLLMAEISPFQYRGFIVSVTTCCMWLGSLLMAQISNSLMDGPIKLFGFAIFTFLGTLFVIRFVPETKGKTAAEIQEALDQIGETSEDRAEVVWERDF